MSIPLTGYADLLKALKFDDPEIFKAVADCLHFEKQLPNRQDSPEKKLSQGQQDNTLQPKTELPSQLKLQPIPFWRVIAYQKLDQFIPQVDSTEAKLTLQNKPGTIPVKSPLLASAQLSRKLRKQATRNIASRSLDVYQVVQSISRGERLECLPRLTQRRWGNVLQIIGDHSVRLTPYWTDQLKVINHLLKWFPKNTIEYAFVSSGSQQPIIETPTGELKPYQLPPRGSLVLAISDLGCLDLGSRYATEHWKTIGNKINNSGSMAVALVPGASKQIWKAVADSWRIVLMDDSDQHYPSLDSLVKAAEHVMTLCAFATRIQPGYLRAVRQWLGMDAAVEALVWQHSALTSPNMHGAPVNTQAVRQKQLQWPQLNNDMSGKWQKALALQSQWRNGYSEELWAAEITAMPEQIQQQPIINKDLERARQLIKQIDKVSDKNLSISGLQQWVNWYLPISRSDPELNAAITRLHEKFAIEPQNSLPHGYQPQFSQQSKSKNVIKLSVFQNGRSLTLVDRTAQSDSAVDDGSPICLLHTRNRQIKIGPEESSALARNRFWKSGQAPEWALDWNEDEYGLWVEFGVEDKKNLNRVSQRMRWIEPGTFIMGSLKDEPGRYDEEGPQHKVTLTRGYWMFDTPVTQALYQAVMDNNPSRFKSPRRPVENVTWHDAQTFIQLINEKIPGLNLSLPTEAQWEYACRAGTTKATYAGAMEILGESNAPVLDEIAWYSGNSGLEFDLEQGFDSSAWLVKQYDHQLAGTRIVAQKKANDWGLYDMLGNVWEWCKDGQRQYQKTTEKDPVGSEADGAHRVLRGGSWSHDARSVRCASRYAHPPEYANYNFGFRCTRVHQSGTGQAAEPAEMQQSRVAQRSAASRSSGAQLVNFIDPVKAQSLAWPQLAQFVIHSDMEKYYVEQFSKPQWADAIGRDQYGLWASFKVQPEQGGAVIQKMRWISPGQFLMGSPEDEPGRLSKEELKTYDLKSESPQHSVELSQGYWLFDTPVTQALYEQVTGDNPSEFKSAQRPIEGVTWHDAQTFIQLINEKIPGLNLSLLTEAQWEYACRAGTTEATYAGAMEILGECNAPVLDEIAWYSGNSGLDFDFPKGEDSSGWPEKQYDHKQAGTRIVAQKRANNWGLYDMLGNVWEWCQDGQRQYQKTMGKDPVGSEEDGARRVLRGGSWGSGARFVRCAYRNANVPEHAYSLIGFRCARVHEPRTGSKRRVRPSDRVAEQRSVDDHARGD